MNTSIETTAYLQIKQKETWRRTGIVKRVTSKAPEEPLPGCVVVKVRIRIPEAAFKPLAPEAVIEIPEDLVQRPVQVIAEDPRD